jgi:hypothetical protein
VLATTVRPGAVLLPWVRSPSYDVLTLLGVPALAAAVAVLGWPGFVAGIGPWYQALAANPHLTATYVRLGTEPGLRQRWRAATFLLPAGLLLAVLLVYFTTERAGLTALVTLTIAWAYWHYTRQSWGVARLYQRRLSAADAQDRWLLSLAIHVPAVAAAVWWLRQAPPWLIGLPMFTVPVPEVLAWALVVVGPLALLPALWRAYQGAGAGRVGRLDLVTAVMNAAVFYLALVINPWPEVGYWAVSLWHTVQYLAIVYATQARVAVAQGGFLHWWTARPWLYYAGVVVAAFLILAVPFRFARAVGVPDMAVTVAGITVWLVVTLHHYLLDTLIWGSPARAKSTR